MHAYNAHCVFFICVCMCVCLPLVFHTLSAIFVSINQLKRVNCLELSKKSVSIVESTLLIFLANQNLTKIVEWLFSFKTQKVIFWYYCRGIILFIFIFSSFKTNFWSFKNAFWPWIDRQITQLYQPHVLFIFLHLHTFFLLLSSFGWTNFSFVLDSNPPTCWIFSVQTFFFNFYSFFCPRLTKWPLIAFAHLPEVVSTVFLNIHFWFGPLFCLSACLSACLHPFSQSMSLHSHSTNSPFFFSNVLHYLLWKCVLHTILPPSISFSSALPWSVTNATIYILIFFVWNILPLLFNYSSS